MPKSGSGYVTRFAVRTDRLDRYAVQEAGGREHLEYWIAAEEQDAFMDGFLGPIEVIASFP